MMEDGDGYDGTSRSLHTESPQTAPLSTDAALLGHFFFDKDH